MKARRRADNRRWIHRNFFILQVCQGHASIDTRYEKLHDQ